MALGPPGPRGRFPSGPRVRGRNSRRRHPAPNFFSVTETGSENVFFGNYLLALLFGFKLLAGNLKKNRFVLFVLPPPSRWKGWRRRRRRSRKSLFYDWAIFVLHSFVLFCFASFCFLELFLPPTFNWRPPQPKKLSCCDSEVLLTNIKLLLKWSNPNFGPWRRFEQIKCIYWNQGARELSDIRVHQTRPNMVSLAIYRRPIIPIIA